MEHRPIHVFAPGSRSALLFAALIGGVATLACGSDGAPTEPPPPSEFNLGEFPPGSYTIELSEEEAPIPLLVGTWTNVFEDDGTTTVLKDGEPAVFGRFTVSGDEIQLDDNGGELACDPPADRATYRWTVVEGGGLTFTAVSEPCSGRRSVITAGTWTLDS